MEATHRDPTRVVVVGGGASGALVAAHLACEADGRPLVVTVLEPREQLGRGLAYTTEDDQHLLNVAARGMSAFPDDPDHFRRWSGAEPTAFLTRSRYGDYLGEVLRTAWAAAPPGSRLEHVRSRAATVVPSPAGPVAVVDSEGRRYDADHVVLATGHDLPAAPPWLPAGSPPWLVRDPWAPGALDGLRDGDQVVCVGTGLTFVDVALTALSAGPRTSVTGVSRHGLLPAAHVLPLPQPDPPIDLPEGPLRLEPLVRAIHARGSDWRSAVDGLRPQTQEIWLRLEPGDRDRFMTHLSRFWDVRRHRMAPQVAASVADAAEHGRLSWRTAEAVSMSTGRGTVVLSNAGEDLVADRVVLCTGPQADVTESTRDGDLSPKATPDPARTGSATTWTRSPAPCSPPMGDRTRASRRWAPCAGGCSVSPPRFPRSGSRPRTWPGGSSPPPRPRRRRPRPDAVQRGDQRVHVVLRVVEREGRPHGALEPEPAQDRLGAVVPGAHRDALPVEAAPDVLGPVPSRTKESTPALCVGRADQPQARERSQALRGVVEQLVLVAATRSRCRRGRGSRAPRRARRRRRCCRCPASNRAGGGW